MTLDELKAAEAAAWKAAAEQPDDPGGWARRAGYEQEAIRLGLMILQREAEGEGR